MRPRSAHRANFACLWALEAFGSTSRRARAAITMLASGRNVPEDLQNIDLSDGGLAKRFQPNMVSVLARARGRALRTWQVLRKSGVDIVTAWDDIYPQRLTAALADDRPLVLFCKGNLELLDKPGVGFCGSRRASLLGITVAQDCARQIAAAGYNVVSGNAKGVDVAAHSAALAEVGTTTIVLSEGILRRSMKPELLAHVDMDRILIVSQFHPRSMWCTGYAMTRNLTICGLTDAMIVVEASVTGGTFHAGESCLRIGRPLYVVDYAENGNANGGNSILIKRGAIPLRKDPVSGRANLSGLLQVLANRSLRYECREPAQQMLFPVFAGDRSRS